MSARLTRLKINRFRDTKPTELHFSAGFNVLLGLNGTGKTTLLDLIAAICADDLSPYAKEAFDVEYEMELDSEVAPLRVHVWWGATEFVGKTRPTLSESKVSIGELTWTQPPSTTEYPVIWPNERWFLEAFLDGRAVGDQVARFKGMRAKRFDEALASFARIIGPHFDVVFAPIEVLPPRLEEVWQELSDDTAHITWHAEEELWIAEMLKPLAFDSVEFVITRNGGPFGHVTELKSLRFRRLKRWIGIEELSFGEKRFLTFHFHLAGVQGCGPFIADELSNGLHHAWIQHCMEKLEGTQSFLSAQGPLVLDKLPWGSAAELQKMFVRCERQGASILWRNLTEEEALELHQSGEQGYEKTSETLKRQGLW